MKKWNLLVLLGIWNCLIQNAYGLGDSFKKAIDEFGSECHSGRNMAISAQPFGLFFGLIAVNYEYRLNKMASLIAGGSIYGAALITDSYLRYGNNDNLSFFAVLATKLHVYGEAMCSGIYLEPRFDIGYEKTVYTVKAIGSPVQDVGIVPSFLVGVDKVFSSGLQLDLGLGLGYHLSIPIGPIPDGFRTLFFVPKFQVGIGWAW